MTKKEQKRYDRVLDDIACKLTMKAYHEAVDITEGVYLDILLRLRSNIDYEISRIQERNKNKNE
jgi:hypothetical protein